MKIILISLLLTSIFSLHLRPSNLPITPKANDLDNHYGTLPSENLFGPKHNEGVFLAREGVTSATTPITPISNFNKEIDPTKVVAGNLDNTSYDASKIVKPEIATPKLEIKSEIVHEAIVKTPVQLGTQIDNKTVTSMNRITGEINTKNIQTEKPIVGMMNNVSEVSTEHTTLLNLNNGKVIDTTPQLGYHGTN